MISYMETLKKIFNHPVVVAIGYVVGIVGFILGIVFYFNGIKEPYLTYFISSTRTPIVQQGNLNNFSVTFMGTTITGDLSSAEILIWNQGKLPIHREDILKTITLRTANGEPIYQTTVKSSRDVIGFRWMSLTNYQPQPGFVQFDWKILEHNDGIKLQIIHGGNVNVPISVEGVVEGQPKGITQYQKGGNIVDKSIRTFWMILFFLLFFVIFFFLIKLVWSIEHKVNMGEMSKKMLILTSLLPIAVGVLALILFDYLTSEIKPPFGF